MEEKAPIRIGTRKSKLALWQAHWVADRLRAAGFAPELVEMDTVGDRVLDKALSKIGSKGVFTAELEAALREGGIHIAVHSAKDMPSRLPEDLPLVAFTERETVNDALVSHDPDVSLDLNGLRVGTSSTRRVALLKRFHPEAVPVEMRGNLQTRLAKHERGDCDALLLAYAGVRRMGYESLIRQLLPLDVFTPAAGQGSMAVQAHADMDEAVLERVRQAVNHPETERRLLAERAFLRKMEGGCSVPTFALATLEGNDVRLVGGLVSLDGSEHYREEATLPDPVAAGEAVAEAVLAEGADALAEIKAQLDG